jgi:type II secretory pathway pseudopilin PulG
MPEIMTVVIIAIIVTTIVASVFMSVDGTAGAEQIDSDLVQSANQALYQIQRDVRQSDPNGIFACSTTGGAVTCTPGSDLAAPTDVQYLAVLTARDGGDGMVQWDISGRPAWTGFIVYWLSPDGSGANDLASGFAPAQIAPGANPAILNADVINAVGSATAVADPSIIAHSILGVKTMVDIAKDRVAIRITSQSTDGTDTNSTSVQSDAYARN